METTYYQDQLDRIDTKSQYAPSVVIHNGENDDKTNWLRLNKESATALVKWLTDNFINSND